MPSIVFANRLVDSDWDETLRAWRCPALNIPGAVVRDIIVEGVRVDKAQYEVLKEQGMIHWVIFQKPERISVIVQLTEELSPEYEKDRWKKIAIVLPVGIGDVLHKGRLCSWPG
jgi:hypothetical protein